MFANQVAVDFVRKYYSRLHSAPAELREFYAPYSSVLEVEEGQMGTPGRPADHPRMSGSVAAITSLQCMPSISASLLVTVVGESKTEDNSVATFTQTFVLQKNGNGYLIASDVLVVLKSEIELVEESEERAVPQSERSVESTVDSPTETLVEPVEKSVSPAKSVLPGGEKSVGSTEEKPKKKKFSVDSVAKAASFQPKTFAFVPRAQQQPAYSPIPMAPPQGTGIPGAGIPAGGMSPAMQGQIPMQYPMGPYYQPVMNVPPVSPGFVKLSSSEVPEEAVRQTLAELAPYVSVHVEAARRRAYIDYQYPQLLHDAVQKGRVPIFGTNETLQVDFKRSLPHRDMHDYLK